MMPGPDLADLITLAGACGGKVIVTGDTSQLQAIQNGGGEGGTDDDGDRQVDHIAAGDEVPEPLNTRISPRS